MNIPDFCTRITIYNNRDLTEHDFGGNFFYPSGAINALKDAIKWLEQQPEHESQSNA